MKRYTIRFILSLTAILVGSAFLLNERLSNSVSDSPTPFDRSEYAQPISSPIMLPSERAALEGSQNPNSADSNVNLVIGPQNSGWIEKQTNVQGGNKSVAAIPAASLTDEPVLPGINVEPSAPQPVPYYAPISANAQEKTDLRAESAPKTISGSATESIAGSAAESATKAKTESIAESAAESTTELKAESATKAKTESIAESAAESATE